MIQALWNYIKQNNLQDKQDRRIIRADARLRSVRPEIISHICIVMNCEYCILRSSAESKCTSNSCPRSLTVTSRRRSP